MVKWNSKNKKHYVDKGYVQTHMGDEFEVAIEDLTIGSAAIIKYECDYCHNVYETTYYKYMHKKEKQNKNDCCGNIQCLETKAQESFKMIYGVDNCRQLDFVNEKIKSTNLDKYGCENPFGNNEVKMKIKQFYIDNFGVEHNMQIPNIVQKSKETCIKKYGCESYTQTAEYREKQSGENSPVWKGDNAKHRRTDRDIPEYRDWRKSVFGRDLYTCQCCGARNGNGHYVRLEAHHIMNYNDYPEHRFDVNNGITLCQNCHIAFHSDYGKKFNNQYQLYEFIENYNTDKKVC